MIALDANHCSSHLVTLSRRLEMDPHRLLLTASTSGLADFKPLSVPGGIARIALPAGTISATFNGASVLLPEASRVPSLGSASRLRSSQVHVLETGNQAIWFEVSPKTYETEHLTIPNRRKVNPLPMDYDRIGTERRKWTEYFGASLRGPYPSNGSPLLVGVIHPALVSAECSTGNQGAPTAGLILRLQREHPLKVSLPGELQPWLTTF